MIMRHAAFFFTLFCYLVFPASAFCEESRTSNDSTPTEAVSFTTSNSGPSNSTVSDGASLSTPDQETQISGNTTWPYTLTEPVILDEYESTSIIPDIQNFIHLPNVSTCESMAEFKSGTNAGDIMLVDFHVATRADDSWYKWGDLYYNILEMPEGTLKYSAFHNADIPYCFIGYHKDHIPCMLANANIYSDSTGKIHLQSWHNEQTISYNYYYNGTFIDWNNIAYNIGYPINYAGWNGKDEWFWQALSPNMCVLEGQNDRPCLFSYMSDHEYGRYDKRPAYYLIDGYTGNVWNYPNRVTMPTRGTCGQPTIISDGNGGAHLLWISSINYGHHFFEFHQHPFQVVTNNIFYSHYDGTNISSPVQVTNNNTLDAGYTVVSADIDSSGKLWIAATFVDRSNSGGNFHWYSMHIYGIDANGSIDTVVDTEYPNDYWVYELIPCIKIASNDIAHITMWGGITYDYHNTAYFYFNTTSLSPELSYENFFLLEDVSNTSYPSHIYVDSEDRVHFLWTRVDPDLSSGPPTQLMYRRADPISFLPGTNAYSYPTESNPNNTSLEINIYPNPASDIINIDVSYASAGSFTFDIFDLSGRLLYSSNDIHLNSSSTIPLDISEIGNLSNGVYIIRFDNDGVQLTRRLVIER